VQVQFADGFSTDSKRLAWLDEKLWLQRQVIKGPKRDEKYPTWEAQYKAWEIDKFLVAETWYIVRHLCEIKLLPLPRLRKLANSQPLAPNFIRGYALCHYPTDEIKILGGQTAKGWQTLKEEVNV